MSDDAKAAKDLVQTLKDGRTGYTQAADKLADSDHPEWAETMRRLGDQRAGFAEEIVSLGDEYGDDVDESGSLLAGLHRGWLSLKDAITADSPSGVLDAVVQGEDHAVSEYDKALDEDLSDGFREVVTRQRGEIVAARDEVAGLRAAS